MGGTWTGRRAACCYLAPPSRRATAAAPPPNSPGHIPACLLPTTSHCSAGLALRARAPRVPAESPRSAFSIHNATTKVQNFMSPHLDYESTFLVDLPFSSLSHIGNRERTMIHHEEKLPRKIRVPLKAKPGNKLQLPGFCWLSDKQQDCYPRKSLTSTMPVVVDPWKQQQQAINYRFFTQQYTNSYTPFYTLQKPTCGYLYCRDTDHSRKRLDVPYTNVTKWRTDAIL